MIGVDFKQARNFFFDAPAVAKAVGAATRRVLSRFGAFVRTSAKDSIRKRRGASAPGEAPHSHTGLLRRFIFFAYDPAQKNVVIGPVRLRGMVGDAPAALEHGGRSTVIRTRFRRREGVNVRERRRQDVLVAQRPYMGPAFRKNLPALPAMWRDSVRP